MSRLLQINSTANWGSTGKIAEQIGLVAMEAGWESYIAYGRSANSSKSKLIKVGSKLSVMWHGVLSRLFDCHGLASSVATKRLVKKISQIKPDIIHLHNIHGYYLNYKILFDYLNRANIPVVWTLHDCWAFTGHCAHYIQEQCYLWKTGCCRKDCKRFYPASYVVSKTKQNYNLKKKLFLGLGSNLVITPVSSWLADQTKQSFLGQQKIHYIYNGVDTSVFTPLPAKHIVDKYELQGKIVLLGVASAWSDGKGFSDYLSLRKKLTDDYVIIMVGLSEEVIKTLPAGIIGIKRTQSVKELAELYSAANIVLSLSRAETFGLTVAEGMSCGTPAIVYNNTATPELITEQTGLVVDKTGDVDGVVESINTIVQNGREYYTAACRKRAEEYFDKDKCFGKYLELYNEILNNNK